MLIAQLLALVPVAPAQFCEHAIGLPACLPACLDRAWEPGSQWLLPTTSIPPSLSRLGSSSDAGEGAGPLLINTRYAAQCQPHPSPPPTTNRLFWTHVFGTVRLPGPGSPNVDKLPSLPGNNLRRIVVYQVAPLIIPPEMEFASQHDTANSVYHSGRAGWMIRIKGAAPVHHLDGSGVS